MSGSGRDLGRVILAVVEPLVRVGAVAASVDAAVLVAEAGELEDPQPTVCAAIFLKTIATPRLMPDRFPFPGWSKTKNLTLGTTSASLLGVR